MILSKQFLNERVKDSLRHAIFESKGEGKLPEYDVFISYSWNDKKYAEKVVTLLNECGYSAYIDYNDLRLDRSNVSEETAKKLLDAMRKCKGLLYLYSPSSSVSKWCPWEVGVFSGIKNFRCANLPLVEKQNDEYKNQEYLELYPYIEYDKIQGSNKDEFWVCEDNTSYTTLRNWINGGKPTVHKN